MLQYDFEDSVAYWIISTSHAFVRAMNQDLAEHGITFRQWEVLVWLSIHGAQPQNVLADCMMIEPPTLVGLLDRMERDGWIERVTVEGDRRKKQIRVTPKVEPVWSKMVACAHRIRGAAVHELEPEKVVALRDTLAVVRANLETGRKS